MIVVTRRYGGEMADEGDDLGDWEDDIDLVDPDAGGEILPSSRVGKFARNTSAGAVLNAVALGLAEVFDPRVKEEAPIVQDVSGDPDDRDVHVHLDPDDPAASSVTFRSRPADESP
jgi:hypothetical protein